jgi:phosphonate transport system substrate-binding protein
MPTYLVRNGLFFLPVILNFIFSCWGEEIIVKEIGKKKEISNIPVDNTPQKIYEKSLNFGITLQKNEASTRYAYKPFIDYLAEQTKINIRLVVAQEYEQLEKDMERGIVHLAEFPPLAFVHVYDSLKGKIIYLATYKYIGLDDMKGREYYQGYIFARSKSKISSIKDLKDKKFAFVEKTSSSGYNYPLAILLKSGVNPDKFFSKIFFTGSHDSVIEAVIRGSADAGATYDRGFKDYEKKNPGSLKIIAKTQHIPNAALCASYTLTKKIRKLILAAVLKIKPDTKTSDGRYIAAADRSFSTVGFIKKSASYYNFVRESTKLLEEYEKNK